MREEFGYPRLSDGVKGQILGRNAARLYGIRPADLRCAFEVDGVSRARAEREETARLRTLQPYGPRTRREFLGMLAREEASLERRLRGGGA
jgi:hypothetical protein